MLMRWQRHDAGGQWISGTKPAEAMKAMQPGSTGNVPTLDELSNNPAMVNSLPPATVRDLTARLLLTLLTLLVPMAPASTVSEADEGERLIGVPEVARRTGMSTSWVEKHTNQLPARKDVCGTPKWRAADIDTWIKTRPKYGVARQESPGLSVRHGGTHP